MNDINNTMVFTGEKDALLFFDVADNGSVAFKTSRFIDIVFTDCNGKVLSEGTCCHFDTSGIYRAVLKKDVGGRCTVDISAGDGVIPFIMPSVGVVWNHGAIFPLLFSKDSCHTIYPVSEPSFDYKMMVIKGAGYGEKVNVKADGKVLDLNWFPKLNREWVWYSAELNTNAPYLEVSFDGGKTDIRFTLWNSNVTALIKPSRSIKSGKLKLAVTDEMHKRVDARYELFIGDERVMMYDIMRDEDCCVTLPVGEYTLKISHGIKYRTITKTVVINENDTFFADYSLEVAINIPKGWVFGELHNHSAFEDATAFPCQTARAARANGKNFVFMTDKSVNELLEYNPHKWDVEGEFIGIPGQEIMCQELHMNVLNTDRQIYNPEADNLTLPNNDIEEKIASWINEYKKMKQTRPCLIMHNHPSHNMKIMTEGCAYFRSWWVSDLFKEFTLVENCDYRGWFDRLNRGRKLYAAWTGDGHDCSLMHPGKEGVCLYVGDELSEESIISALEKGCFFNTCEPGVFIEMAIGDTITGGVYEGDLSEKVKVRAASGRPVELVELIVNGRIHQTARFDGEGVVEAEFFLPKDAMWFVARVRCSGEGWDETVHSFTPFMAAGYDGFTNPIFISLKYIKE